MSVGNGKAAEFDASPLHEKLDRIDRAQRHAMRGWRVVWAVAFAMALCAALALVVRYETRAQTEVLLLAIKASEKRQGDRINRRARELRRLIDAP